jgi:hypothetical protein
MREMTGFKKLREHGRIAWIEQVYGWVTALEDVLSVLSTDGFSECKRETTTSRRDCHPAGGVWQGVDARTGSVASLVWVQHAAPPDASCSSRSTGSPSRAT